MYTLFVYGTGVQLRRAAYQQIVCLLWESPFDNTGNRKQKKGMLTFHK